ncbi:condensin complex subunit 3-like [Teleopsis dalmanni]|uniref:condensin complex subunit 3-like n=1 Tax=Teleopsis dalmanni TaxID=139649 RepID=UPI0018CE1BCD|nr:condensin complex subunit 3-like [Teleopsis dalmanni]
MVRKRKIAIISEEKENQNEDCTEILSECSQMYTIMSFVQKSETFHNKYTKEMKSLYTKVDHKTFLFNFIKIIKTAMEADEQNTYAQTSLLFCAKFVCSYGTDDAHPIFNDTFNWLLNNYSRNQHIRYRLCQFVNLILTALGVEAALEDEICDRILEYMLDRLCDLAPNVRVQAIHAIQRLQIPDKPDDPVVRAYQFHLCSDPSPRVRQAVITCLGRNYHTIPYILDRLWDIDEKVRRHTYVHMSNYPVRSYKVSQRLTLLEQGLNDRSELVKKAVVDLLLRNWIETFQKNLVALVFSLKLDSNEEELVRFRKIAKQTLSAIFKTNKQDLNDLIGCLPFESDCEFYRCVPLQKLSIEVSIYWQCLAEYLQSKEGDIDCILPELSVFCAYVKKFCELQLTSADKFELIEFYHILHSFMEILYIYDLGDETGRRNLHDLIEYLLTSFILDEKVIKVIILCAENVITDQDARMTFLSNIVRNLCNLRKENHIVHDRTLINELLANSADADLNLKISALKVKILELEEQETNSVLTKDYVGAHSITEEKNAVTIEFTNLMRAVMQKQPDIDNHLILPQLIAVSNETVQKSLQIIFNMIVSEKTESLSESALKLYNDFIFRHIASNQIGIRDWALKCAAAFSMIYEPLAKDVFEQLFTQFFKNHNMRLWETSIKCIFELLTKYGFETFVLQEEPTTSKKSGRPLYNFLDDIEDDAPAVANAKGDRIITLMLHFLNTVDDVIIINAILEGFCRLVLHGHVDNSDILEKILLFYFNPHTDSGIHQTLGVFLECFFDSKLHYQLEPCLLPMVTTIISAPCDSPLRDIRPETITRFIISTTCQEVYSGANAIHIKLAVSFLNEMIANNSNKELCKLLTKELRTLQVSSIQNQDSRKEIKELVLKLISTDLDSKMIKTIVEFKELLEGSFVPQPTNPDVTETDDETNVAENASVAASEATTTHTVEVEPITVNASTTTSENNNSKTVGKETTAVQNINTSPNTVTPTRNGRNNGSAYRHLRKSLNMKDTNNTNTTNNTPNVSNSGSPKIRIELRIDSDKKTSEEESEKTTPPSNVHARRNLEFTPIINDKGNDGNSKDSTADHTATDVLNKSNESNKSANISNNKSVEHNNGNEISTNNNVLKSNQKDKSRLATRSKNKDITNNDTGKADKNESLVNGAMRTRRNVNKEDGHTDSINNGSAREMSEPSTPDVITESPTVMKSVRVRKPIIYGKDLMASSVRTSQRTKTPSQKITEQNNTTPSKLRRINHTNISSTELRNGRKRILKSTPLNTVAGNTETITQPRKRACLDEQANNTQTKKLTQSDQEESSNNRTLRAAGESPSSTKENEFAVVTRSTSKNVKTNAPEITISQSTRSTRRNKLTQSNAENNTSIMSLNGIDIIDLTIDPVNENDVTSEQARTFQEERTNRKHSTSSPKRLVRSKSLEKVNTNNLSTSNEERRNSITTRNSARKERQLNQIMTRNRLQHEMTSIKVYKNFSSKIPVRRKTYAEPLIIKSNGNATSNLNGDISRSQISAGRTGLPMTKSFVRTMLLPNIDHHWSSSIIRE